MEELIDKLDTEFVASRELVNNFFEFVVVFEVEPVDFEAILFLDLGKEFCFAPLFVDFALTVLLLEEMRPAAVAPGTLLFEFALREDELVVLEISVVRRRDVELDEVELLFVRVVERLAADVKKKLNKT